MTPIDPQDYSQRVHEAQMSAVDQDLEEKGVDAFLSDANKDGVKVYPEPTRETTLNDDVNTVRNGISKFAYPAAVARRLAILVTRYDQENLELDEAEQEFRANLYSWLNHPSTGVSDENVKAAQRLVDSFPGEAITREERFNRKYSTIEDVTDEALADLRSRLTSDEPDPELAFTPEAPFGEPVDYQEKSREVVRNWMRNMGYEPNVYTVWFAKTLQNHKSMISTDEITGYYFEVTYDGDKDNYYLDVYLKQENIVVTDV